LTSPGADRLAWPWRAAVVSAAALAFVCKILLALKTYGTNDVYTFESFMVWSRYLGVSLYREAPNFNHPPSMIHALRFLGWAARATGLPFQFCLRFPGILADVGSLWLVCRILRKRLAEPSISRAVFLLALAPPSILISGFHGNTDTVMIFFLLLSVYLAERDFAWPAGIAFGLAMSVKVLPLICIPVFLLYPNTRRWRIAFFFAAAAVLLLAWSPYLFQDPVAVLSQVFGYRSHYGIWGLSYLAVGLGRIVPGLAWLNPAFGQFGARLSLILVAALSYRMNRSANPPPLFSQVGLVLFFFLAASSGFGVQYLAWVVPFVVPLGAWPAALLFTASGAFLFLVYNDWSQGLPWYLADSFRVGVWPGSVGVVQFLCWLSLVTVLGIAWKRIRHRAPSHSGVRQGSLRIEAGLAAATAVGLVMYAAALQIPLQKEGALARAQSRSWLGSIRARSGLELSRRLYRLGRYADSAAAANEALRLQAPHSGTPAPSGPNPPSSRARL
jgi:hypothetical protein